MGPATRWQTERSCLNPGSRVPLPEIEMPHPPPDVPSPPVSEPSLRRSIGLVSLVLYGVGNMVGAGVYVLVGKAVGELGNAVWMGFVAAMVAAGLTGLSYASLGSRYPKAAGAAYVTQRAFGLGWLTFVIGLAVTASGMTSMATASHGLAGFVAELLASTLGGVLGPGVSGVVVLRIIAVAFLGAIALVNFLGIRESVTLNALCTLIEVGGLLLVIALCLPYWGSVDYLDAASPRNPDGSLTPTILMGSAVLIFFAFIGFEDLLNVSEEVKNPRKTFPIALVSALLLATLLYLAVAVSLVSVVSVSEVASSKAPLSLVVGRAGAWLPGGGVPPWFFTAISIFAVANTALLNYIMGSRILYGMSRQGLLPGLLGRVHPKRRTPHVAIGVLGLLVAILVIVGNVAALGRSTSLLLLVAFTVVNGALAALKLRRGEPRGGFEVPIVVPLLGAGVCLAMIGANVASTLHTARNWQDWQHLWLAPLILLLIAGVYLAVRPRVADRNTDSD